MIHVIYISMHFQFQTIIQNIVQTNYINFHSVDKINLSQILVVINSNSEFYLLLLICKKKDVGI